MRMLCTLLLLLPIDLALGQDVEKLSQAIRESPRSETVVGLLPQIGSLLRDESAALEALPLVEQAAEILRPSAVQTGHWPAAASLLRSAARMRYEQAEPDKAGAHLKSLLALYGSLNEGVAGAGNLVALEYLRGAQAKAALDVLGQAADLPNLEREVDPTRSAVAGALNRRLQQLSTEERYQLLHAWTLPAPQRVRVLESLAAVDSPPDVFARALGERPQTNAFPIPRIGDIDGLFSSAWALVRAAAESGRLRRLTIELEELKKANVPSAEHVWLLARIGDKDVDIKELHDLIHARMAALRKPAPVPAPTPDAAVPASEVGPRPDVVPWLVLAAACLEQSEAKTRGAIGEEILATLIDPAVTAVSDNLQPFVRRAQAIALLKRHAGADATQLADPKLKFWVPASEEVAARSAAGAVRQVWLAHEDHLLHLAGPHNDYLCFRYPLTGEFEFQVEAQNGGPPHTFGGLAFGGLAYGVAGNADELRVWDLDLGRTLTRSMPFVRKERWPTYQRLTLRSSVDGSQLLINGHPVWTDASISSTSPWLALRSYAQYVPMFRNARLSGKPVIPREVRLADGKILRGWLAQFYPSRVPEDGQTDGGDAFDWHIRDGMIHGAHRQGPFSTTVQSSLAYFRPLENDESISYEFLYEPGRCEVHPAAGRLAFLIEPGGVRVHWMTGGDAEWTGLAESNATIEPLNRRGPRPLPLKAGQWNRVTMSLANNTLGLTLNDVEVYQRKMESQPSWRFSFYHDRSRAAAQVRNVVLRGKWPERFSEQDLANLAAPREKAKGPDPATRRWLGQVFAERHISDSALLVHRRAATLPPSERLVALASYVLPGPDHDTLRLSLDFAPNNGDFVSPALDLVEVAKQLGRLAEVRQRTLAVPQGTDLQKRQRLALLSLVDIAGGDAKSANDNLLQLFQLLEGATHTEFEQRWPETLAAFAALRYPATRGVGRELAFHLHLGQARNGADSGSEAWRRQTAALAGLARYFDSVKDPTLDGFTTAPPLKQWTPVSHATARSRGSGYPRSHWQLSDEGIEKQSGHSAEYLYFQSPLAGDFEVEYDAPAFGWRDTQIVVAGEWVAARYDLKSYAHGHSRRVVSHQPVNPPFKRPQDWIHYRIVVRDGTVQYYCNGRLLRQRPVPPHADPWLAIRTDERNDGGVKNVWISGKPRIPEVVQLAGTDDLAGWQQYYDTQVVGPTGSGNSVHWRQRGDLAGGGGLVGRHDPHLAGSFAESLLRYHRPMLEDGTIEYEFYYRPGESHCHPALDRLAFLLDPAGVRIHWITDDRYDRTDISADNAFDEPQYRRGGPTLPLKVNAWNRVALNLQGDAARLSINGQLVYERPLEPANQRTFGVFHFADQTEARVRHIAWRGDWPRDLPPLAQQELVGDNPTFLDEQRDSLAAAFEHDFATAGFPPTKFSVLIGLPAAFSPLPDGLHIDQRGGKGYKNATFAPLLRIQGDFDIIAAYDQLVTEAAPAGSASLYLQAFLDNPLQTECGLLRRQVNDKADLDQQFFQTMVVTKEAAGERRNYSKSMPIEAFAGRLRLARRGKTVYFLIAEGDSSLFRLVRTEQAGDDDIASGNLRLINQTKEAGRLRVVWKTLSIRAEKLSGLAAEDSAAAVAELNRQRAALPVRFAHDFTRDRITPDRFSNWGFSPTTEPRPGGLRVSGQSTDNWTSAGMNANVALPGDFDASFEFDLLAMTPPKAGLNSGVYLQIEVPDEQQHQYSVILIGSPDGDRTVLAQSRERSSSGAFLYPSHGRAFVDQVQRLRFARRGNQLYFLYAEAANQSDRVLAQLDLPASPGLNTVIRMLVHTGGAGNSTDTAWKKLVINAR